MTREAAARHPERVVLATAGTQESRAAQDFAMSDFLLTLVLPIKTSKIINDMAKVQQKSEKITTFGGIFFVFYGVSSLYIQVWTIFVSFWTIV